jgi:hypothetical protein
MLVIFMVFDNSTSIILIFCSLCLTVSSNSSYTSNDLVHYVCSFIRFFLYAKFLSFSVHWSIDRWYVLVYIRLQCKYSSFHKKSIVPNKNSKFIVIVFNKKTLFSVHGLSSYFKRWIMLEIGFFHSKMMNHSLKRIPDTERFKGKHLIFVYGRIRL